MVNAAVSKTARCVQTTGCGFKSYHPCIERQFNGRTLFLNLEINFYSNFFLLREPVMQVRILPFRLKALQDEVGFILYKNLLKPTITNNRQVATDCSSGLRFFPRRICAVGREADCTALLRRRSRMGSEGSNPSPHVKDSYSKISQVAKWIRQQSETLCIWVRFPS